MDQFSSVQSLSHVRLMDGGSLRNRKPRILEKKKKKNHKQKLGYFLNDRLTVKENNPKKSLFCHNIRKAERNLLWTTKISS